MAVSKKKKKTIGQLYNVRLQETFPDDRALRHYAFISKQSLNTDHKHKNTEVGNKKGFLYGDEQPMVTLVWKCNCRCGDGDIQSRRVTASLA